MEPSDKTIIQDESYLFQIRDQYLNIQGNKGMSQEFIKIEDISYLSVKSIKEESQTLAIVCIVLGVIAIAAAIEIPTKSAIFYGASIVFIILGVILFLSKKHETTITINLSGVAATYIYKTKIPKEKADPFIATLLNI